MTFKEVVAAIKSANEGARVTLKQITSKDEIKYWLIVVYDGTNMLTAEDGTEFDGGRACSIAKCDDFTKSELQAASFWQAEDGMFIPSKEFDL